MQSSTTPGSFEHKKANVQNTVQEIITCYTEMLSIFTYTIIISLSNSKGRPRGWQGVHPAPEKNKLLCVSLELLVRISLFEGTWHGP